MGRKRKDPKVRLNDACDERQHGADTLDYIERGSIARLQDGHQHSTMPILANNVGLHLKAIAYGGNIAHVDHRSIYLLDGDVIQFLDCVRSYVVENVVLTLSDLCGAGGQHHALRRQRPQNIARRETFRLHEPLVHIDHDLTLFAAIRRRNNSTRHRDELRANEVQTVIVQLLLVQTLPRDPKLQDWHTRGAAVNDLRLLLPRRKSA